MTDRLYVLAFDHRRSLMTYFFGVEGEPSPADAERASRAKRIIWEGLQRAGEDGASPDRAAALVDATYGADVIAAARTAGVRTAVPVEESGREVFGFEVARWKERLAELDPTWAKALVRYNPADGGARREEQSGRLRELSDHCLATGRGFMLELLVPPSSSQLADLEGDRGRFDREIRAGLTAEAIGELHDAGVEPDLWKHEGFDERSDYERVVGAARDGGRDRVGCLILGRGEDAEAVDRWLRAGAGVVGVVGSAIGRTIWWDPLRAYFEGAAGDEAVARIAANYRRAVDVFESAADPDGSVVL